MVLAVHGFLGLVYPPFFPVLRIRIRDTRSRIQPLFDPRIRNNGSLDPEKFIPDPGSDCIKLLPVQD
jgi:hypothetical protein